MYTILITDTNELVTSQRERIMQRSKLVDTLHFLTDQMYKGKDMTGFTVNMEYIRPISKERESEILTLSEELYKDKLEYKLPIDTKLTKEAGDVEIQITFLATEMDADGNVSQYVRKTSPCTLTIIPIAEWSNVIADSALASVDQRLIQTSLMIHELEDMQQQMADDYSKKADNLSLEDNQLQLTSDGNKIGDPVTLKGSTITVEGDGNLKVVNF